MRPARHIAVTIDCPFDRAYALAHPPRSFEQWAAGLANSLSERDGQWIATTPIGEATVHFSPPNDHGVLDHDVTLPDGSIVDVPMRMMPNAGGTEVVLTLFRQPGMDDATFARDAEMVGQDLATLKAWLEASA